MRNSVTCPPFPQPKISTRLGPPSVGPTCRDHPRYLLPPQFLHRLLVPRYPPFFPGTPRNCTPTGGPSRDAPKLGHDEPALARLKQVKRLHRLRQTSSSFYKGKGSFSSSYLPFCHPLPHCPPLLYFSLGFPELAGVATAGDRKLAGFNGCSTISLRRRVLVNRRFPKWRRRGTPAALVSASGGPSSPEAEDSAPMS